MLGSGDEEDPINMLEEVFVLTSDRISISRAFYGYAFFGADLVVGQEGYDKYILSGNVAEEDADGCYLEVSNSSDGETRIATDFHGYYPLYYYVHEDNWGVSSSLQQLARVVSAKGWPLTRRQHQLDAWRSDRALLLQLSSHRTVFNEICNLSYDKEIVIKDKLEVRAKERKVKAESYREALAAMIEIWSARIEAILRDGMAIRLDLSGGVDSRTIMALLMSALRRMGRFDLLSSAQINVNSQKLLAADFQAAGRIAQEYGFPLNNKERERHVPASGLEALNDWRHYNLGRYAPHILPVGLQKSNVIAFPGVGGEEHRPFYEKFYGNMELDGHSSFIKDLRDMLSPDIYEALMYGRTSDIGSSGREVFSDNFYSRLDREKFVAFLRGHRSVFSSDAAFDAWFTDVLEDLDGSRSPYDAGLPIAMRHYRRHRGRHHSSKKPANEILGVIFGSKAFHECTFHASDDDIENNQILFDVMFSCDEALAVLPYDQEKKAPRPVNFERKTVVSGAGVAPSGRVWRDRVVWHDAAGGPSRNECLNDDVLSALARPAVLEEIGTDLADKVRSQLGKMGDNNLHGKGFLIHYALLAGLVMDLT